MSIVYVITSLARRCGGPSTVTPEMSRTPLDRGDHIELMTANRDGPGRFKVPIGHPIGWRGVPTTFFRAYRPQVYTAPVALASALRQRVFTGRQECFAKLSDEISP